MILSIIIIFLLPLRRRTPYVRHTLMGWEKGPTAGPSAGLLVAERSLLGSAACLRYNASVR